MTCADYYTKATLLMKFSKSSVFSFFFTPIEEKTNERFYFGIVLHILWDYDTHRADCSYGYGVGVTGSVHTWQCFLLRDASGIQWRMEFPQDSPFVSQEAADKFGSNMLSQERHATDSSSSILFTDWAGESESEQPAFITPAHGNSQCVWSCFSHIHTLCLSHRDTFKGACQSRGK